MMNRILIPLEQPLFAGLSSYYLDPRKLIEHFRESTFTGCLHFQDSTCEGAVYFDWDEILSAVFFSNGKALFGKEAIEAFHAKAIEGNLSVSLYSVSQESLYFWANLVSASPLYENLKAEFTNLQALIQRMQQERLTGYITVELGGKKDGGVILLQSGELLKQVCRWENRKYFCTLDGPDELVEASNAAGTVFSVHKVNVDAAPAAEPVITKTGADEDTASMLAELLRAAEDLTDSDKRTRGEFNTLLKRKFLEKAEDHPGLDPWYDDFQYRNGKVHYEGEEPWPSLLRGVLESLSEMARENGVSPQHDALLKQWVDRHGKTLAGLGVMVFG